jgi:hypothetical protein
MTKKNIALVASIATLVAISGQAAFARPASNAQYWPAATSQSHHRQALRAFNAINPPMAAQTMAPDAHRYHGGPKYND